MQNGGNIILLLLSILIGILKIKIISLDLDKFSSRKLLSNHDFIDLRFLFAVEYNF